MLEGINQEIKRRTRVVRIFPNQTIVSAILIEIDGDREKLSKYRIRIKGPYEFTEKWLHNLLSANSILLQIIVLEEKNGFYR